MSVILRSRRRSDTPTRCTPAYFHDRLTGELAGLAGYPPDRLVAAVRQALHDFLAGDLLDDVTMLAVRVGRAPKAAARASAPVSAPARAARPPSGHATPDRPGILS
jgi:hypothetical protein